MGSENQLPVGLNLTPLDTLFFRDGRPFEAADRGRSVAHLVTSEGRVRF